MIRGLNFYYRHKNCRRLFDFRGSFQSCNIFILIFGQSPAETGYSRGLSLCRYLDPQISLTLDLNNFALVLFISNRSSSANRQNFVLYVALIKKLPQLFLFSFGLTGSHRLLKYPS